MRFDASQAHLIDTTDHNRMVDTHRRSFLRGGVHSARIAAPHRPPWSLQPDARFTSACTRCGDCVRACPVQVLHKGDGGYPAIRFDDDGCTLCGDCARACTPRAIDPASVPVAFPWRVQVSAACLAQRGVECRVCGDACGTRALRFVPARGGIAQMRIDLDACTGCGACRPVCPVRAIEMAPATASPSAGSATT